MSKTAIQFFYQTDGFSFRNRNRVKEFLRSILRKEKTSATELRIIFCSDEQLLQINRQYLNHDYYTDIITFNLSGKSEPVNAELYISTDRIKDNAVQSGSSFSKELHRVIFHGILHLCGYNDKSSQQIKKMREREDYYLRLFFGQ